MSLFRWVLVFLGALIGIAGVTIGATLFVFFGNLSNPPEQTAQFLPQDTLLYVSVNLRPGANQLSKLKNIFERFDGNEAFGRKIDDLIDQIEDESRIDLKADVFPWLGPELSIALLDFGLSNGSPEVV